MSSRKVTCTAAIAIVTLVAGCGGGGGDSAKTNSTEEAATPDSPRQLTPARFAGTLAAPRRAAPLLALQDSFGRPIDLARLRGHPAIVTFVYVHCPDVCPVIMDNLRAAQVELGPAAKDLHVIAVSVDPEGDTPSAVNSFLAAHRITHRVSYLVGSRAELEQVWHDWGIVSKRSPKNKDPDIVEHSAMVYGIAANGEVTTLYPSSFDPADIAHDVPMLASG